MVAISLLDAFVREDARVRGGASWAMRLAANLVDDLLAHWQRVRQFQDEFSPNDWSDPAALTVERSIYALHEAWAADAEQVLIRLRRLAASGQPVSGVEALEDALGSARAACCLPLRNGTRHGAGSSGGIYSRTGAERWPTRQASRLTVKRTGSICMTRTCRNWPLMKWNAWRRIRLRRQLRH